MPGGAQGPGVTTSFYTRSTLVFPVPRSDLQDSLQSDTVPGVNADTLRSAATLQTAMTLNSAVSVDDSMLQSSASVGPPRVGGTDTPVSMGRRSTVRGPGLQRESAIVTSPCLGWRNAS